MKILSISLVTLPEPIPVYDLTVLETENFLLDAGVFVHNSKDVSDAVAGANYALRKARLTRSEVGVIDDQGDRVRSDASKRPDPPRRK